MFAKIAQSSICLVKFYKKKNVRKEVVKKAKKNKTAPSFFSESSWSQEKDVSCFANIQIEIESNYNIKNRNKSEDLFDFFTEQKIEFNLDKSSSFTLSGGTPDLSEEREWTDLRSLVELD